jgi:hypothetical protein
MWQVVFILTLVALMLVVAFGGSMLRDAYTI